MVSGGRVNDYKREKRSVKHLAEQILSCSSILWFFIYPPSTAAVTASALHLPHPPTPSWGYPLHWAAPLFLPMSEWWRGGYQLKHHPSLPLLQGWSLGKRGRPEELICYSGWNKVEAASLMENGNFLSEHDCQKCLRGTGLNITINHMQRAGDAAS